MHEEIKHHNPQNSGGNNSSKKSSSQSETGNKNTALDMAKQVMYSMYVKKAVSKGAMCAVLYGPIWAR